MLDVLNITAPDDWHVHFRDEAMMRLVAPFTARQFARAVVMPNLVPPVVDPTDAWAYKLRIKQAVHEFPTFEPLMTIYLTDDMDPKKWSIDWQSIVTAVKLYPAHATTNSAHGVTDMEKVLPALEFLAENRVPLLVHGEVTDPAVDIFDREAVFIDKILEPLRRRLPELKIVMEHITTEEAVFYVITGGPNIAATITGHHLLINRNSIFQGGIRPHMYCLPIAKREKHRLALVKAATSGDPHFFLGTDSAPHAVPAKENNCGCAGIFTATNAIEIYASVFDQAGRMDNFEAFASFHGADFYGLPRNDRRMILQRLPIQVPHYIEGFGHMVVPFMAAHETVWRIAT